MEKDKSKESYRGVARQLEGFHEVQQIQQKKARHTQLFNVHWQIWMKVKAKILPKMICPVFDANSAQGDGEDQEPPCRAVWGGGGPAEKSYFPGIFTFWLKQWKWKGNREKRHRQKHGGGDKSEKEFSSINKNNENEKQQQRAKRQRQIHGIVIITEKRYD